MSISNKDNTLRGARNLGRLGTRRINGYVGSRDRIDFAKFTLGEVRELNLSIGRIANRASSARVTLRDARGAIIRSFNTGRRNITFLDEFAPGTYFIGIQQIKGEVNYKITAAARPAEPGERLDTARDLGVLAGTSIVSEAVGAADPSDIYKFTLNDIANLQVRTNGSDTGTRFELIRDINANGLVDNDEIIASDSSFAGNSVASRTLDLPPGTYFVRVQSTSVRPTPYQLDLIPTFFGGNVSPEPGNTIPLAADLGILSGTRSFREYVGRLDPEDFYRFTLNDLSNLQITGTASTTPVRVQLVRDANNNGLIDANEAFFSREGSGVNTPARINQDLPPGTYFIRVDPRFGSTNSSTSYEMTVVTTPYGGNGLPDPGNTLSSARDLGVLSSTTSLKEYVGVLDSDDFYRFTLSGAANLQARLTNSSDISSDLILIRDTNNNGLIDNNEILASAIVGSSGTTLLTRDLQAGSYFIRVKPRFTGNFSTNYQLDLTPTYA
ncbi:hypothetical protein HNI00_13975 [Thermoleptolyngbya oregonensis NK1-22]|uniref:Peptidase C-terminal archaeal/bacterial domain-containing protein n=1 Tax=Thermoleptolyngbya oregonensis NK1-22 TaxID=2547457 RepID=A0AA96YPQ4_9CYAN|nr:hypothetical protein [Thermoleptolyngbya oregonensis]WOB44137.1 hypothetical protein HNI00_13975 [Thermoleptolyngbya oregonensis NK1-22]